MSKGDPTMLPAAPACPCLSLPLTSPSTPGGPIPGGTGSPAFPENPMTQSHAHCQEMTHPSNMDHEERRAWSDVYRTVERDVDLAAEVMQSLDTDPLLKRSHLALYLRCRQSVRSHRARRTRNRRMGQALRLVWSSVNRQISRVCMSLRRIGEGAVDLVTAVLVPPSVPDRGSRPPERPMANLQGRTHPLRKVSWICGPLRPMTERGAQCPGAALSDLPHGTRCCRCTPHRDEPASRPAPGREPPSASVAVERTWSGGTC
jgi:hypothetical protein